MEWKYLYKNTSFNKIAESMFRLSDSDVRALSESLDGVGISLDESKISFLKLKNVEERYNLEYPCSFGFMSEVWEQEYGSKTFKSDIRALLAERIVSYAKVTEEVFVNCVGSVSDYKDIVGKSLLFGVFYQGEKYKEVVESIEMNKELADKMSREVIEAVEMNNMSDVAKTFVKEMKRSFEDKNLKVLVESFNEDDLGMEFNFQIRDEVERYFFIGWANQMIGVILSERESEIRERKINELELYVESEELAFLAVSLKSDASFKEIADAVFYINRVFGEMEDYFLEEG